MLINDAKNCCRSMRKIELKATIEKFRSFHSGSRQKCVRDCFAWRNVFLVPDFQHVYVPRQFSYRKTGICFSITPVWNLALIRTFKFIRIFSRKLEADQNSRAIYSFWSLTKIMRSTRGIWMKEKWSCHGGTLSIYTLFEHCYYRKKW